jgi:hypothetical protein
MMGKPLLPFFKAYRFQMSGTETLPDRLVVYLIDDWKVFLPGYADLHSSNIKKTWITGSS